MAAHLFHEIYLHLVWHTKGSMPLITPELEPEEYHQLKLVADGASALADERNAFCIGKRI